MVVDAYLASASPRRKELLEQLGVRFAVRAADIPEVVLKGETARQYVQRLALEKATKVWLSLAEAERHPVIGADTEVVIDEHILGKPVSRDHAIEMLTQLSGRTHQVLTGVAVVSQQHSVCVNVSSVRFRVLDKSEIEAYWQTGEPADKAGAYAIQGFAAAFIEHLNGSYSGVMGLPLYETTILLRQYGVPIWQTAVEKYE